MADITTDLTGSGAPGRGAGGGSLPFPDELAHLADRHAGEVCGDDAWDLWVSGEHDDRLALLDADLAREPGTAVRVEVGLSRAAERARRSSRRALGALSFGAVRTPRQA